MAAETLGRRLLGEIDAGTVEDLLGGLRKLHDGDAGLKPVHLGIPELDAIWSRHGGKLEITGSEGLALLYEIVSTVVSPPRNATILIVDADGRFDVTKLSCAPGNLKHVHVYRPLLETLQETLLCVEGYLLGGDHASMGRECIGICVSGAIGGDIMVGWRGWLKVESERRKVPKFGMGVSAEEAMGEREQRQVAVDKKGWRAVSEWGDYMWVDE